MGWKVNTDGAPYDPSVPQLASPLPTFPGPTRHPLRFLLPADFDWISRVLDALPDAQTSWTLVQFYFSHVNWFVRVSAAAARSLSPSFLTVFCLRRFMLPCSYEKCATYIRRFR